MIITEKNTKDRLLGLFIVTFIGIAVFRFWYCAQLTVNTGDSVRHICWGLVVNQYGYSMINKPLFIFGSNLSFVSWSALPYNYPIVCLIFDQLCARIFPSVFVMKLMLTVIEFINAMLVFKYAKCRLLSLVYWASPISIWWVSHEGQFEPLQNLFVLAALILFKDQKRRNFAYLMLGFAIQVKFTAVFLLPFFILSELKGAQFLKRLVFLIIAMIPSMLLILIDNPLELLSNSAALHYNPYFYNVFNREIFKWNSTWLIISNQLATYSLLFVLVGCGIFKRNKYPWAELLPAILFIIFIKVSPNAQFWYMVALLPLLLPVSDVKLRKSLFLLSPFLDVRSVMQIMFGPFGWTLTKYYQSFKNGAFTDIRFLFK